MYSLKIWKEERKEGRAEGERVEEEK